LARLGRGGRDDLVRASARVASVELNNATLINSRVYNSKIVNGNVVNSQISSSLIKDSIYSTQDSIKVLYYDEWNISLNNFIYRIDYLILKFLLDF
jgi:hypothetical protein